MNSSADVKIVLDSGKGRAFIITFEGDGYIELAEKLAKLLTIETRVVLVKIPKVTDYNWGTISESLRSVVSNCGVRQASFVAFAGAASVVMNLALLEIKLVRTLVLIDASTRPHPRFIDRIIDRIEQVLPLGLPLRSSGKGFDAKSFLQRLRCPVLVVISRLADHFIIREAEVFRKSLPSGWVVKLNCDNKSSCESDDLGRLVVDFQQIPAKCPQKNVA